MIVGTGLDIVETVRLRALIERAGMRFVERWFSPGEIAYCCGKADPCIHLAARMAAKEAAVKALGLHWDGPIGWRQISVIVGESGVPALSLEGLALRAARALGASRLHLSISHCEGYAAASVIAEG